MHASCVFCQIIANELPARRVFEDDHVIAFLNIRPIQPGHTLVVPKRHVEMLLDTPSDLAAVWIQATQRVARALQQATNCAGFNLGQNNGKAAGQEVPHLHMHIIPRYVGDGLSDWASQPLDEARADALAAKMRELTEI